MRYLFVLIPLTTIYNININFSEDNNINQHTNDVSNTEKTGKHIVNGLAKFFGLFYNFDISIRATRLQCFYPFYFGKDGSITLRFSFFRIFKNNRLLRNNFIFELNFLKTRDLGGRGLDFLVRKFGDNILLTNWNENNKSKMFASGSYFFSMLDKTAIFFSIGLEGSGLYNKIFKTNFVKSGFGIRFPLWCSGPFTLVKNLNLDYNNENYDKEKGCIKWKNLGSKKPLEGFLFNIIFYFKPFIYEFDNGFRIDITWETSINDYRYAFYKIKKNNNTEKNIQVYNIADKVKNVNCFRGFLIVLENIIILKTKCEIGINLSKFI